MALTTRERSIIRAIARKTRELFDRLHDELRQVDKQVSELRATAVERRGLDQTASDDELARLGRWAMDYERRLAQIERTLAERK